MRRNIDLSVSPATTAGVSAVRISVRQRSRNTARSSSWMSSISAAVNRSCAINRSRIIVARDPTS
jgi:hypothetical protein